MCLSVTFVSPAKSVKPTEMPFGGGATQVGPSNHILDGDQHQTNPFAAARGDKSAIRPHTAFSQITMDICCVFLVRLCGKPFGCIAAQRPCCVTFGCNSCCRFFVCSVVHCVVACSAVCMRGVCVCVCVCV